MLLIKNTYRTILEYSTIEKLQLLFIIAFVSTLTLNIKVNNFLLIVTLFLLLLTSKISDFKSSKVTILLFVSIFIISCISLLYSSNIPEGSLVLERQLALFFIPILYYTGFKITPLKFNIVLLIYFVCIFCVCIYLLNISVESFAVSKVGIDQWFVSDNLYHSFARPIKMHATYLSLYIALGLFIGCNQMLFKTSWGLKLSIFLIMLVMVVTLILLSSRVVILSVLFILFFVYPFYTWRVKYKSLMIIAGGIVLLLSFFVVRESDFIKNRFLEKTHNEVEMTNFLKPDSNYNPIYGGENRADRWYCAIELIKEKPLLGYGTGSEKEKLMEKYRKYNLRNAIINNYDAHNQYLAYAIKGGLFNVVFFVILIIYGICIAIKYKSFIYLSFMLLFSITCLTENVLESNKGIFFFAFFNTFLSVVLLKRKKSEEVS